VRDLVIHFLRGPKVASQCQACWDKKFEIPKFQITNKLEIRRSEIQNVAGPADLQLRLVCGWDCVCGEKTQKSSEDNRPVKRPPYHHATGWNHT
jgi:hypothetical protein